MIKIGYVSDLHFEYNHQNPSCIAECEGGDILILAGDIISIYGSHYPHVMKQFYNLVDKFDHVLYVFGNHEFYGGDINTSKTEIAKMIGNRKVSILDNDVFHYSDDIVFIGTTLWTDFLKNSFFSKQAAKNNLSDYQYIANNNKLLIPEDTYQLHLKSKQFLHDECQKHKDKKMVIITHHGATYEALHPRHRGNDLDGAFVSDMSSFAFKYDNINAWISGHTHYPQEYTINKTLYLSNPRGYDNMDKINFTGIKYLTI